MKNAVLRKGVIIYLHTIHKNCIYLLHPCLIINAMYVINATFYISTNLILRCIEQ